MDEILKHYPVLENLYIRQLEIDEIDIKIKNEKDTEEVMKLTMTMNELSKIQSNESFKFLMDYINNNSKRIDKIEKAHEENKEICIKFSELLKDERTKTKEMFDSILMAMMIDPVEGFQLLLNYADRNNKIEDQTGQSWMYSLKFTYKERLLMAYRLIKPTLRKYK